MPFKLFVYLLSYAVRRDNFELFVFLCDTFPKQNERYLAMAEEAAKEAELLFTEEERNKCLKRLDERMRNLWGEDII